MASRNRALGWCHSVSWKAASSHSPPTSWQAPPSSLQRAHPFPAAHSKDGRQTSCHILPPFSSCSTETHDLPQRRNDLLHRGQSLMSLMHHPTEEPVGDLEGKRWLPQPSCCLYKLHSVYIVPCKGRLTASIPLDSQTSKAFHLSRAYKKSQCLHLYLAI